MTKATDRHTPVKFIDGYLAGKQNGEEGLCYLSLEVVGSHGTFTGYVPREVIPLVKAAPDLLALARQYASECVFCQGDGIDADGLPCENCADIRSVIARATSSEDAK